MTRQNARAKRRDTLLTYRLRTAATPRRRLQAACDHLVAVCADAGEGATATATREVLDLAKTLQEASR